MCSIAASADTAPVNKIIGFSCVDGPGNRTAVFLQGCDFSCKYCHNPETIRACDACGACVEKCPTGALTLQGASVSYDIQKCVLCDACIRTCTHMASPRVRRLTAEQVMAEAEKNRPFVRGLTVSGGECTLHRDFLLALAQLCRAAGLTLLLDSNGSYDFAADQALTEAVDGVMLDVKAWNRAEHIALTGADNDTVLKNLTYLAQIGKLEEARVVVCPDAMNAEETVAGVATTLARIAPDTRFKLIRYRAMGVRAPYRETLKPPDEALMRALEARAHTLGIFNTVLI